MYKLSQTLREKVTLFGTDLVSGPSEFRMQIRSPDRNASVVALSLTSASNTANGSGIDIKSEQVIAPVAVSTFGASGSVEATNAGFQVQVTTVSELDSETGDPKSLVDITENVAKTGDIARLTGSTSNDGDYRVESVTSEDAVVLRPAPTVEAAAGTIEILRQGRFEVVITAEDSDTFDFDAAEYDLEWIESPGAQPIRILQGKVILDRNATK